MFKGVCVPSAAVTSPGSVTLDDSLTDLEWLIHLPVCGTEASSSPPDNSQSAFRTDSVHHCESQPDSDYYRSHPVKPPHPYSRLITMALSESADGRLTLAEIYQWLKDNFLYYAEVKDLAWQNSIRHNLSINKCFQKVARRMDQPGTGAFWCLVTEDQQGSLGTKRKLDTYPVQVPAPPRKCPKTSVETRTVCANISSNVKVEGSNDSSCQSHVRAIDFDHNPLMNEDIAFSPPEVWPVSDISAAYPITALSPPPSESGVEDCLLDDLLSLSSDSSDSLLQPMTMPDIFSQSVYERLEPCDQDLKGPMDCAFPWATEDHSWAVDYDVKPKEMLNCKFEGLGGDQISFT